MIRAGIDFYRSVKGMFYMWLSWLAYRHIVFQIAEEQKTFVSHPIQADHQTAAVNRVW